jgi:hypothetical protein
MSVAALALLVCALACPVGTGLMIFFMRKGHGHSASGAPNRAGEERDGRAD